MADDDTMVMPGPEDDWPSRFAEMQKPEPLPRGHVDITSRLLDGTVWRVATVGEQIRLTIAGPDGMATAALAPGDVSALRDALGSAELDVSRSRRGTTW